MKTTTELNLEVTTAEQAMVKRHLTVNASEVLADKINNGAWIEKDGKRLLNRKDLAGFFNYACEEARKQAEKGARFACIDDQTVYGMAVHYFEEDSIIGVLYNEDGSEAPSRQPPRASVASSGPGGQSLVGTKPANSYTKHSAPKPKAQMSFFDMQNDEALEVAEVKEPEQPEAEQLPAGEVCNEVGNTELKTQIHEVNKPELVQISDTQVMDSEGEIFESGQVEVERQNSAVVACPAIELNSSTTNTVTTNSTTNNSVDFKSILERILGEEVVVL